MAAQEKDPMFLGRVAIGVALFGGAIFGIISLFIEYAMMQRGRAIKVRPPQRHRTP